MFSLYFTLSIVFFITVCNLPNIDSETLETSKRELPMAHLNVKTLLVILIISSPENINERKAIRETWLKNVNTKEVLPLFVIGVSSLVAEKMNKVNEENLIFNDLLLIDLEDSYLNLTNKVLQAFIFIDKEIDFTHVLKVDDDSFVRVPAILEELQLKPKDRLYWGFFDGRANVKTNGKWKEKSWFLCDKYLPYARGGGYILSGDIIHYLAINHDLFQFYLSEDVSVGTWLAPLKINRVHDKNFDTEYISRGCLNSFLIIHKQNVSQIYELNYNLLTLGRLCTKEFSVRGSYEYNWSYPPSKCCQRDELTFLKGK